MKPFPILVAVVTLFASVGVIAWMSRPGVPGGTIGGNPEAKPENPLAIPETGPFPKAVLEEESYDFGKMILGETNRHAFAVRNEGQAPLRLKNQYVTCKCTEPTTPEGEIPPGESAEVVIEWEPDEASPDFAQHAIIWTNDPENEELTLQIKGEVRQLVHVVPPAPWTIGMVAEEGDTRFEGNILSGEDSFQVMEISATKDWLTAEVEPLTAEDLEAVGPGFGSGYRVRCTVRPEMTVGRFEETLKIHTDLGDDHVVSARVVVTRPGPFSIIGKNWHGGQMTLRMGDVSGAEGKSVTMSLFTDRAEEPIAIESIEADPDIVEVALVRDESFDTPFKEKYELTFTIPPNAPTGRFRDGDGIDVTIRTNRTAMEEIRLSIDANIE